MDYLAELWLNGSRVGGHEGGEAPLLLDVTDAIRAAGNNLLAVRVLNSTNEPIDGIVLSETPHRNKVFPYRAGASYHHGGIVDSERNLAPGDTLVETELHVAQPRLWELNELNLYRMTATRSG